MLTYNVLNSWVEKMMKKDLPVKIKTSNITSLSTKDINKLKAGDIVLKKTGNQKHAYIVSYKEDKQGICLTYTDASVIETVSYDYNTTTKTWVYNSTDITQVQPKLNAGNNVQINGNTISATDTTYTAGTGISIVNGVINATGGGGQSYLHTVEVYYKPYGVFIFLNILTNNNTPFNVNTIQDLINNYTSADAPLPCTGYAVDSANQKLLFLDGIYNDNVANKPKLIKATCLSLQLVTSSITTNSYTSEDTKQLFNQNDTRMVRDTITPTV